jgi:hypothetical protein
MLINIPVKMKSVEWKNNYQGSAFSLPGFLPFKIIHHPVKEKERLTPVELQFLRDP